MTKNKTAEEYFNQGTARCMEYKVNKKRVTRTGIEK
jgi:hypothetical protein